MNDTAPTLDARIAAFASDVRRHLGDLPVDDVDELVDGLEADLADQAADSGDAFALPDAAAYAAELRAAAGLPERAASAATRVPWRERAEAVRIVLRDRIRSSRAGAWLLDLAVALRPVWWVLRGWVFYVFTIPLTGNGLLPVSNFGAFALFIATTIVSVQWGRGRWLPVAWLRIVRTILNIAAAVAVPIVILSGIGIAQARASVEYYDTPPTPGLAVDGDRVRNIFAYDSEGNALTGVQLFDQDGKPLTTVGRTGTWDTLGYDDYFAAGYGGGPVPVPLVEPGRSPVWNVYPLAEATFGEDGDLDTMTATAPTAPFPSVAPLQPAADATPSPSPTDAATPAPTAGATPAPTASARP